MHFGPENVLTSFLMTNLYPAMTKPTEARSRIPLIDLAVVAANLGNNLLEARKSLDDPLVAKAIAITTDRPLDELAQNPDALLGTLNAVKGKYFELLVAEKLNAGERLGELRLQSDLKAALADSLTQPGWDLAIVDGDGRVVDHLQLKATDSVSYISETLERYPDIRILTTNEAASAAHGSGLVIDSGISDRDIESVVGHAVDFGAGGTVPFLEAINPLFPLAFIMASEGFKVAIGRASVEAAVSNAMKRASHGLSGILVGGVFQAMGFGWFSIIPAVLAARAGPEGMLKGLENAVAAYEHAAAEELRTRHARNERIAANHNRILQKHGLDKTVSAADIGRKRPVSTGIAGIDDFVASVATAFDGDIFDAAYARERARQKALFEKREADRLARKEAMDEARKAAEAELNMEKEKIRRWADGWIAAIGRDPSAAELIGNGVVSMRAAGIEVSSKNFSEMLAAVARVAEARRKANLPAPTEPRL